MRTRAWIAMALCSALTPACGFEEIPEGPPKGYVGSIDLDGRDFGKNHYGDPEARTACDVEPDGATRLTFVVESRTVHVGKFWHTEVENGSVVVSAPGQEANYEVDLPWSHVRFDARSCTKTENRASAGAQNFTTGAAEIECKDAERGDTLKVAVQYQGC